MMRRLFLGLLVCCAACGAAAPTVPTPVPTPAPPEAASPAPVRGPDVVVTVPQTPVVTLTLSPGQATVTAESRDAILCITGPDLPGAGIPPGATVTLCQTVDRWLLLKAVGK